VTRSILIGIPTGWNINAVWQANLMSWVGQQRTEEIALHFEPSNTKACSYSRLIDLAIEGGHDGLLLWETNVIWEVPLQFVLERTRTFHCSFTPGRFQDDSIGSDAIFYEDTSTLPSEDIGDGKRELMPYECRWGATHATWIDRETLKRLEVRFTWAKKDSKLDHDMPIYCYDGDLWPDHPDELVRHYGPQGNPNGERRLSIEQSLYSNIRAQGVGVWADPQLKTVNLRLGGAYRSLRLEDLPAR
jgi:hypothetical protein